MGQKALKAKERGAFEEWAKSQGYDLDWLELIGQYDSQETEAAWGAWYARSQLVVPH